MKIKERKLFLYFLKLHLEKIEKEKKQELSPFFKDFFTRMELMDILKFLNLDQFGKSNVNDLENDELLNLIGNDASILKYYMYMIENGITAKPTLSESEIKEFFERAGVQSHYLHTKPNDEWDSYDVSNYYSLLWKHGKSKRVFAIFTSSVNEEDKYAVTTQPSFFFDTREEAEQEIEKIIKEKKFKRDELKIMSLWQMNMY